MERSTLRVKVFIGGHRTNEIAFSRANDETLGHGGRGTLLPRFTKHQNGLSGKKSYRAHYFSTIVDRQRRSLYLKLTKEKKK